MGCNCGGSARQTNERLTRAEQAARRQGVTLDPNNGYYFTGPPRPPAKTKTAAK